MAQLFVVDKSLVEASTLISLPASQASTANTTAAVPTTPGFEPIGIGKPLSIQIMTTYVGKHMSTLLDKDKNVLLTSAVKSLATYNASAKAMNFTKKNVIDFASPEFEAVADGTPIVYYTQALDTETISITFNFIADNFNQDIFNGIASLFTAAAGLPVFLPAAGYFMIADTVTKTLGDLGNTLFQKPPFLSDTIKLSFDSPLFPIPQSQLMLVCNDGDAEEFKDYSISVTNIAGKPKAVPIDAQKNEYKGNAPYLIISVDGRDRKNELANFAPTLATAAILQQFYGTGDTTAAVTTTVQAAMALYNDSTYSGKAKALKEAMAGLNTGSAAYLKDKQLFDAYNTNIQQAAFKVTLP